MYDQSNVMCHHSGLYETISIRWTRNRMSASRGGFFALIVNLEVIALHLCETGLGILVEVFGSLFLPGFISHCTCTSVPFAPVLALFCCSVYEINTEEVQDQAADDIICECSTGRIECQ
jgi:hypothetical protein